MSKPTQTFYSFVGIGAAASTLAAPATGINVAFKSSPPYKMAESRTMDPLATELIEAKMNEKVASLRGDIRLNTDGLANLKVRLDELSSKLSSVPVDLAVLKTRVEHLPGKGFIVTSAGSAIVLVTGLLVLLQKFGVLH